MIVSGSGREQRLGAKQQAATVVQTVEPTIDAAGDGDQVIAVGEAYESKAAAQNGIESVKKNAPDAAVVEV